MLIAGGEMISEAERHTARPIDIKAPIYLRIHTYLSDEGKHRSVRHAIPD